jgi:CheY-like chemotaxis protein
MAKVVLIEDDCRLLDVIAGRLRKKDFAVEPICAETPEDFLTEVAQVIYQHNPKRTIVLLSDYHLPGIKGIELIRYARDVAIYLGFEAIRYGIMSSGRDIHLLPELAAIPTIRKDEGLKSIVGFVENLAAQGAAH